MTARQHALAYLAVLATMILAAGLAFTAVHVARDQARDCEILAAAAASSGRPARLLALSRQFRC